MAITPTFPGVYIEEIPSGVRTIVGVATSITAFIGRALRGPVNDPIRIQSFADFERAFGGLSLDSTMSYAVQQYFLNGGIDALIVRVVHSNDATPANNASKATVGLPGAVGTLNLDAANEGTWGSALRARVDYATRPPDPTDPANSLFNLTLKDMGTGGIESFRNVSTDPNNRRFVTLVLDQQSNLVDVRGVVPATRPTNHPDPPAGQDPFTTPGSFSQFGSST